MIFFDMCFFSARRPRFTWFKFHTYFLFRVFLCFAENDEREKVRGIKWARHIENLCDAENLFFKFLLFQFRISSNDNFTCFFFTWILLFNFTLTAFGNICSIFIIVSIFSFIRRVFSFMFASNQNRQMATLKHSFHMCDNILFRLTPSNFFNW